VIYQISIIRLIMSYVFIGNLCRILHMYKWWYYFLKILSNLKLVDLSKCEVYPYFRTEGWRSDDSCDFIFT